MLLWVQIDSTRTPCHHASSSLIKSTNPAKISWTNRLEVWESTRCKMSPHCPVAKAGPMLSQFNLECPRPKEMTRMGVSALHKKNALRAWKMGKLRLSRRGGKASSKQTQTMNKDRSKRAFTTDWIQLETRLSTTLRITKLICQRFSKTSSTTCPQP